jgi:hypothetical protein
MYDMRISQETRPDTALHELGCPGATVGGKVGDDAFCCNTSCSILFLPEMPTHLREISVLVKYQCLLKASQLKRCCSTTGSSTTQSDATA